MMGVGIFSPQSARVMTEKVALLLEDEALIAIDVGQTLAARGYAVRTIDTCATAIEWLKNNPAPVVAVIDVEVRGGRSHTLAAELLKRGIPFVVHWAGIGLRSPEDDPFRGGILLPKPSTTDALINALQIAVDGARA
jgi:DNA-binding NtrC family response regulator